MFVPECSQNIQKQIKVRTKGLIFLIMYFVRAFRDEIKIAELWLLKDHHSKFASNLFDGWREHPHTDRRKNKE